MKRVLFVDDEQNVLDGLQNRMRRYRPEMNMVFAPGGAAALMELAKEPVDVIVSDMRMPGMDGATLLGKVKEHSPGTVRMILSGYSDHDAIFRALGVAHQFLAKPCDGDKLFNAVKRACQLVTLLKNDSMRNALGRIENLPSLPAAYWELVDAFSRPDITTRRIADIMETDPAMCVKVLKLVNSACFGGSRTVTSVERAVAYLGMDLIKSLTLSVNIFSTIEKMPSVPGFSFDAVQTHSFLTAKVARAILPDQSADVFTAALLHDIGHSVLACCDRDKFKAVIAAHAKTGRPLIEVETEIFGLTHAGAGAYLLGLWGLPYPLIEAVAYHHEPQLAGEQRLDLPAAVSIADVLVDQAVEGGSETGFPAEFTDYLESLGVLSSVPKWREIAAREVDSRKGVH